MTIARCNTLRLREQVFHYYESDRCIVEYTWPNDQTHRLAMLPDRNAVIDRLTDIFPVVNHEHAYPTFQLDQSAFFKMKELAEAGLEADAVSILSQHTSDEFIRNMFIHTIQQPIFGGTVSMFLVDEGIIADACDLAIVQGDTDAWIMMQTQPGIPIIRVERVDLERVRETLLNMQAGL